MTVNYLKDRIHAAQNMFWDTVSYVKNGVKYYIIDLPTATAYSAGYAAHRNGWYTAPQEIVAVKGLLRNLQEIIFSKEPDVTKLDGCVSQIQNSYPAMQEVLSADYYALSDEDKTTLGTFTNSLDNLKTWIVSNSSRELAKFKSCLGKVLALVERWGESHGPYAHLKKRFSRVSYSIVHEQTEAELETEKLVVAVRKGKADENTVKFLIWSLAAVIVQRSREGIGDHNARELSKFIACQAQLQEWLSPESEAERDAQQLGTIVGQFPLHLVQSGYRTNLASGLTSREPPKIITDAHNIITKVITSASIEERQLAIKGAGEQLTKLIAMYPNENQEILQPIQAIVLHNSEEGAELSTESWVAAQKAICDVGSTELGWRHRTGHLNTSTVIFQRDYTPAIALVDISLALKRFGRRLTPTREDYTDIATELGKFNQWLEQPEQNEHFTSYFRTDLQFLQLQLAKGIKPDNFKFVCDQLEYASTPGYYSRMLSAGVSPSPNSLVLRPVKRAYASGKALLATPIDPISAAATFCKDLGSLIEEYDSGNLDFPYTETSQLEKLGPELELLQNTLQQPNWMASFELRDQVRRITRRVLDTLEGLIGENQIVAVNKDPVFREEFHELLARLYQLDVAIKSNKPEEILEKARLVWSFSTALSVRFGGNNEHLAEYQLYPKGAELFREFTKQLYQAIDCHKRSLGTCDPQNPNFRFRGNSLLEEKRLTLSDFLSNWNRDWKQKQSSQGYYDSGKQFFSTIFRGSPRKKLDLPKPPSDLLREADEIYVSDLSKPEVRSLKRKYPSIEFPKATKDIREALPGVLSQVREAEVQKTIAEADRKENENSAANCGIIGTLIAITAPIAANKLGVPKKFEGPLAKKIANDIRVYGQEKTNNSEPPSLTSGNTNPPVSTTPQPAQSTPDNPQPTLLGQGIKYLGQGAKYGLDLLETAGVKKEDLGVASKVIDYVVDKVDGKENDLGDLLNLVTGSKEKVERIKKRKEQKEADFRALEKMEAAANFSDPGQTVTFSEEQWVTEKVAFREFNKYFVTMSTIRESQSWFGCGLPSQPAEFYGENFIHKARAAGPDKEYAVLKETFLAHLEREKVSYFRYYFSWLLFPIIESISGRYLKTFTEHGFEWIRDLIVKISKDPAHKIANDTLDNINGFFETALGAYGRIGEQKDLSGKTKVISGNLDSELEKELSNPKLNHNLTQAKLHQALANKIIEHLIEPGVCQWTQRIRQAANRVENPVANVAAVFASWIAWVLLILPELFIRKLIVLPAIGYMGVNGKNVGSIIGAGVSSLKPNSYTHTLNCLLYDFLQEIHTTVRRELSGGAAPSGSQYSIVDKEKIQTFVHGLSRLINLHSCRSAKELSEEPFFIKKELDKALNDKLGKNLEELLAAVFHIILKEDSLKLQFHKLVASINSIYKKEEPVRESEYQQKVDDINLTIESILTLVVDTSVDKVVDLDKNHEQKVVKGFEEKLLDIAKKMEKNLRLKFEGIQKSRTEDGILASTAMVKGQLEAMVKSATASRKEIDKWGNSVEASNSGLKEDGKDKLLELQAGLMDQIEDMNKKLRAIYLPREQMSLGTKVAEAIARLQEIIKSLVAIIVGEAPGAETEKMIQRIELHFKTIASKGALTTQAEILRKAIDQLKLLHQEWLQAKKNPSELASLQDTITATAQEIEQLCTTTLDKCKFDDKKSDNEKEKEKWEFVVQGMDKLKKWIDTPPKIVLEKNTSWYRHEMERGIEWVKDYVGDHVRDETTGLLSLIRDPTIWKHLVNHTVIYPIIKA